MKSPFLLAALAGLCALSAPASAQWGGGDPTERLEEADANHDGVITREEYRVSRAARFDRMDRNNDGVVSRADFSRILRFRPEAGQRLDQMLAQADSNHDGRITRAEMNAAPMPIFDRIDANHDGRVTRAELADAKARLDQARADRR